MAQNLPNPTRYWQAFVWESSIPAAFTLTDNLVTPNDVILAHYKRAGEVKKGTL